MKKNNLKVRLIKSIKLISPLFGIVFCIACGSTSNPNRKPNPNLSSDEDEIKRKKKVEEEMAQRDIANEKDMEDLRKNQAKQQRDIDNMFKTREGKKSFNNIQGAMFIAKLPEDQKQQAREYLDVLNLKQEKELEYLDKSSMIEEAEMKKSKEVVLEKNKQLQNQSNEYENLLRKAGIDLSIVSLSNINPLLNSSIEENNKKIFDKMQEIKNLKDDPIKSLEVHKEFLAICIETENFSKSEEVKKANLEYDKIIKGIKNIDTGAILKKNQEIRESSDAIISLGKDIVLKKIASLTKENELSAKHLKEKEDFFAKYKPN